MAGGLGINFKIDKALTDFPEPDSPTIESVSPGDKENEISFNTGLRIFLS
jgi:hypothetical protein